MILHRRFPLALAAAALIAGMAGFPTAARAQESPEQSLKDFQVPDGLELTLFASEPQLVNPTDIDIDARGRVWVLEAANYRRFKYRPEGDRIVILEDTDKDGKADKTTVFYQDPSLFAPLGIAVLGNKVYVAQSPNVLVFTIDESGDKPVGPPQVLFTGFTGENHDHGVHAGVFGPDGRYYFNSGNEGMGALITRADKTPVVDSLGSEIGRKAKKYRGRDLDKGEIGYQEGMAFRCDPDGKNFETLGYNFRNNYELTVDSFGTVWQSDNDDDGNQGVRINYVMEGGNFGYKGPKGTDWGRDAGLVPGQTKQQAHWHQLWPGVVPNLLNTGGGSPTGITVYEGDLLPDPYRGALIHADAGPNVIRAYVTSPSSHVPTGLMNGADAGKKGKAGDAAKPETAADATTGAGYRAESIELVKGKDKWFRPSDVCVAPDGSIFIADWYDPGVGGHNMQDAAQQKDWHSLRGRIYRLAPKGSKYAVPNFDFDSVKGQIQALHNPNFAVRYLAWTRLHEGGPEAVKALEAMHKDEKDPRQRARALWLLARSAQGKQYVEAALKDPNPDIRITALRAARLIGMDLPTIAAGMVNDSSPQVRRELALAMNYVPADKAIPILVKLADQYDGQDRWYLEALGIGATGKEDAFLSAWAKGHSNKNADAEKMILWRMKKEGPMNAAAGPGKQAASADWRVLRPFVVTGGKRAPIKHDLGPRSSLNRIALHPAYRPSPRASGSAVRWRLIATDINFQDGGSGPEAAGPSGEQMYKKDDVSLPASRASAGADAAPASRPAVVHNDKQGKAYPPPAEMAKRPGDAAAGKAVFSNPAIACNRCHQIGDEGGMIGPPLTTIGDKLSKQQIYESIVDPSAGILMGFEAYILRNKEGDLLDGLKVEDTEDHITIKDSQGEYHDVPRAQIASLRQQPTSLMPEGLGAAITQQEMADLLEYLSRQKNP